MAHEPRKLLSWKYRTRERMPGNGVSKELGVPLPAAIIMAGVSAGDFRFFERFALILRAGRLLLIPVFLAIHPSTAEIARNMFTFSLPVEGKLIDVTLLLIAVVGTTISPWQLFFQQSYVIDERITPRFVEYEHIDLWLGITLVAPGSAAMIAFTSATLEGREEYGSFVDAGAVAQGIGKYAGRLPEGLFALALIDASITAASAVSLSTACAIGHILSLKHSLHRKPRNARAFYGAYFAPIAISRRRRAEARCAARPADECGPDAGRRSAPRRNRLPAAAQRAGGARPVGQFTRKSPLGRRIARLSCRRWRDHAGADHRARACPLSLAAQDKRQKHAGSTTVDAARSGCRRMRPTHHFTGSGA